MASTEQYFPRGGYVKNEKDQNSNVHAKTQQLFGENSNKAKKNRKTVQTKTSKDLEPFSMSNNIIPDKVDTLTYQKIQDGMLLLGCVKYVTSMNGVQVQLPGCCVGHINIQDISYEYTKYLAEALETNQDAQTINKPVEPGDFIPVKVLTKITEENGFRLQLSAKPEDVNANIHYNKFSPGMKLWASIIERSDHCYNLNAGMVNCRVVLPFKKSDDEYYPGQNIWCAIQQANIQDNATILTVSTIEEDMQKVVVKGNTSLDVLTPGITVTFEVKKVLKDGLCGSICQNSTAFIDTMNLSKTKDNPQNYKLGQKLNATLLYVQNTTKFSYLTLQSTSSSLPPSVEIGTKLNAKVLARKDKGILISLKSDDRGFIPFNRLQIRQGSKTTTNDPAKNPVNQRLIAKTYPNNGTVHVRVIDYNYMERSYLCSNQTNVMNDKYFSISDLKIGDIVKGNIKEIKANGVVMCLGRIQGFIPNIHICDIQFADAIKSKLKVNHKITAKVLNIKPSNVYFTLKKALISSDVNLSSADQINTASHYPGVVVKITNKIILVQFYGGFSGQLNISDFKNKKNVKAMFYIGQVITTSVSKIEDDTPILTLTSNISNGDLSNSKETVESKKKGKKRTLSETATNNELTKKSKITATDCDSTDINDSDDCDMETEEKIKPILKGKESEKRRTISFAEEPLIKTFNKSSRANPTAPSLIKPLAIRGVSDFFTTTSLRLDSESDSNEDEDIVEPQQKPKKKSAKQTAAERREKERLEEERLRAIEVQLADSSVLPQSAEHFDRLLVGQPNSSKLWAQYIAFHMQSIELEKARSTARRALQTINLTDSQERLNIWTIFLNLEHEYGTKDSYDEIFKEATSCNNSLPIYLLSIENHLAKGELTEADNKVRKLKREHKNNLQMWFTVGKIYYENKKIDEARKLKDDGLRTITDKTMQIDLIIKFAIFEFTYGDSSQGETLFETIVQSDPKRVNVWSTYIDQLVKKNDIDLARRVLDRAVGNKIPFKKMRTLFKKYYQFEKQHGDAERLAYVEKLAKDYALSVSAL